MAWGSMAHSFEIRGLLKHVSAPDPGRPGSPGRSHSRPTEYRLLFIFATVQLLPLMWTTIPTRRSGCHMRHLSFRAGLWRRMRFQYGGSLLRRSWRKSTPRQSRSGVGPQGEQKEFRTTARSRINTGQITPK